MTETNHLGGHGGKTWVDEGALTWAKNMFGITSMVDIGCGPGGMEEIANRLGIAWEGIDGDPVVARERVISWDFSVGPLLDYPTKPNLGWSVEFLEHVDEIYQNNYMQIFKRCDIVIATAAPPGFGGHHHVNEQPLSYWIEVFDNNGLKYNKKKTEEMKGCSTMFYKGRIGKSFMKLTGMVFDHHG